MVVDEWGYPAERVALGLEGGYNLDSEACPRGSLRLAVHSLIDKAESDPFYPPPLETLHPAAPAP